MFLRKILGKKEEKKEQARQELPPEGLRKELTDLREGRIRRCEEELRRTMDEIVLCRDGVLRGLCVLCEAKPSPDVHSGLIRAAESARRLLSEKLRRALVDLKPPSELSSSSLAEFSQRLAKSVNLTTDAMTAHGRYVGAVFERELREVVMSLERMQMLSRQMHETAGRALQEVRRLDSLVSELDSVMSSRGSLAQELERLRELEAKLSSLDSRISEEEKRLEELRGSEEYRAEVGMREEAGQAEGELQRFRNEVSSMFSEISRPLKKAWKLVETGSHPMDKERARVLRLCIEDPLTIFSEDALAAVASEVIREVGGLVEERKVELEEKDRRKKLERVRNLASNLSILKGRFDELTARTRGYREREQPSAKAEAEFQRVLGEMRTEREKLAKEIEELRKRMAEGEAEYGKNLARIAGEAQALLGREIVLTS
ncbi:MAG: hypothetical protein QW567_00680 [Candidatus Hadarchaeales archaeon]